MNYTFAYPWVLVGLVVVPLLAAYLFMPRFRHHRQGTFVFSRTSALAAQTRGWRRYLQPVPDLVVLVSMALMIVALARPQGVEAQEVEVEGIDIYLSLDMSGSMQAIDNSEAEVRKITAHNQQPVNRFDAAVGVLKDFVDSRESDRIGMVVFAKDAFLQFPLTLDYNTIDGMLDRLEIGDIDAGGTAIGNAVGRAVAGLQNSEATSKILILITDGDRRGGNISPMQAAKIASDLDVKVFPILVGRDGPTLVPTRVRTLFGVQKKYKKHKFPVDPDLLKQIAHKTDGQFYRATDARGLKERIHTILDQFERTRIEDASNVDKRELFVPFIIWAVCLIAGQLVLRHTLVRKFP